ncbi:MAG: hypothetical protein IBJ03_10885 [Gemmatimonadaceae bacterium]|nr:hypothetical protein [Gemmatimonadaceae bacterium]
MRTSSFLQALLLTLAAVGASACKSDRVTKEEPPEEEVLENTYAGSARYVFNDSVAVLCSMAVVLEWDSTRRVSVHEQHRFGSVRGDVRRALVRRGGSQELALHHFANAQARGRLLGSDSMELTLWPESTVPAFVAPLRVIKGAKAPDNLWKGAWNCAPTGRVTDPVDTTGLAVGTWQTTVLVTP